MALRISKNRIHLSGVKNLCKRILSSQYGSKSCKSELEDNDPVRLKDICGNFRYRVCTDRSSPVERPTTTNVEYQHKAPVDLQHLQPAMLPSFYQKDMTDTVGFNVKISVEDSAKKNAAEPLPGLQASKTYSNVHLPLKPVRLATPFPDPVRTMDSCKVSDEEKAEIMLKEAKSSQLAVQRRNYSSLAHPDKNTPLTKPQEMPVKRGLTVKHGPTQNFLAKSPNWKKQEKIFFSSVNNAKNNVMGNIVNKPVNVLRVPGCSTGPTNLFHSQSVNNPNILNLPPASQIQTTMFQNVKKSMEIPIKISLPTWGRKFAATSKSHPKTAITDGSHVKTVGFKIKRLETRSYASKAKTDECGRKTCEKLNTLKNKDCPKMCLPGCPPANKNTACHGIAKKIKCTKQEAPYPAYSELCHEDPDERPTECNMCPWASDQNPNFKPAKKNFHSYSLVRTVVANLGASADLVGRLENRELDCCMKKKPCKPPCGNTCADREEREKERQKKRRENKPKKTNKEATARRSVHVMKQHLSAENELLCFAENRNPCREEKPCGAKEEPKCKKFPFPPSPPIKQEEPCRKPKKRKLIKDCPKDCDEKVCRPTIIPGTSIMEPFMSYKIMFDKKKKDEDKPSRKSTRPTGPPEDPCNMKKKGRADNCPDNLIKKPKHKDDFTSLGTNFM